MQFEFKVKIQSSTNANAKQALKAMFDIKKALKEEDLLLLAESLKNNPSLIKRAKMFL